jgi:6-phosphogluconolactonase (cycloisomerase 2 family)
VVDPFGKFLYAVHQNGVDCYAIDPWAGTLILIKGVAMGAGVLPRSIAIEPSGRFAYVANAISGTVSLFSVDSTNGNLTALGSVPAGASPNAITVDASGRFAYVVNQVSNDVSVYSINSVSGALSPLSAVPAGAGPVAITTTGTIQ